MDNRETILQIVRMKGPILPLEISKALETNVLFASAMLSELVDKKILKLSSLKVGGSPLYFAPGQEIKLQNFTERLNVKEKEAYDLLRKEKILRDRELEPVVRVALRAIKDFAVPLQVNSEETKEIFWKWYLTEDSEAEQIIKKAIGFKKERKKEVQEQKPKEETQVQEKGEQKIESFVDNTDSFLNSIRKYFQDNSIDILDVKTIRKKSDFEFTIKVPSAVGKISYFCKAKNKKKFNDGDLSSVFVQGQTKKLPVLYLITGDLTKKAKDLLDKEFKNVTVKNI
ncbi:hypothetical protein ACFLZ7_03405 [Nanoarchaeota archaeon]